MHFFQYGFFFPCHNTDYLRSWFKWMNRNKEEIHVEATAVCVSAGQQGLERWQDHVGFLSTSSPLCFLSPMSKEAAMSFSGELTWHMPGRVFAIFTMRCAAVRILLRPPASGGKNDGKKGKSSGTYLTFWKWRTACLYKISTTFSLQIQWRNQYCYFKVNTPSKHRKQPCDFLLQYSYMTDSLILIA